MAVRTSLTKRHCMIVYAVYPLGETRVQREAEALVRSGYDVDVICLRLKGEAAVDQYKGVSIFRERYTFTFSQFMKNGLIGKFFNYIRFFLSAAFRVSNLHLKDPYGSIQVHNLPDFLVFCAFIPKILGVPIILDLHDLMPEFYAGRFGRGKSLMARLIRLQENLSCRFADHVITVSEHWKQALIRRGVPETKCSVIMNVADENIFSSNEEDPSIKKGGNGFRMIYHGAIVKRYGLDLVVRAMAKVRHDIRGIHLKLLGLGDYLPELIRLINELELNQFVSIIEPVLAEELPAIIKSCDLGIVPYRDDVFTDGLLPTKLMEYSACGLPAIAARTTAIESYFRDTMAEFFEPGNVDDLVRCITYLHKIPARLIELARGCQIFNQRYNWAKIGAEYVSLVDRLRLDSILRKRQDG